MISNTVLADTEKSFEKYDGINAKIQANSNIMT